MKQQQLYQMVAEQVLLLELMIDSPEEKDSLREGRMSPKIFQKYPNDVRLGNKRITCAQMGYVKHTTQ